jgi:ketosteroid isomerase-like protein
MNPLQKEVVMLKMLFYVLSLSLLVLVSCQPPVDMAAEEAAIKAVNQKQLEANEAFNFEGESAVWLHAPYILHATAAAGEGKLGWDSLSVYYKERFDAAKKDTATQYNFTVENFTVQIEGNAAFVTYDESFKGTVAGNQFDSNYKVHKYFIKKEGEWKILAIF